MTKTLRRVAVAVALATVPLLAAQSTQVPQTPQQQAVFQAGTSTVLLDVAVRHNDDPVLGLKPDEFEVLDNGVPQQLDYVTAETNPIDLTLVLDESGSLESMLDEVKKAVNKTATLMTAEDKIRLIAFNDVVKQVYDGPPDGAADEVAKLEAEGATSIYDAIVAALIRPKSPGRRALVVTFTDGQDTSATISPTLLTAVAKRAEVVLDVFLAYDVANPIGGRDTFDFNEGFKMLRGISASTGGLMDDMLADDHVAKALRNSLLDFKARYLMAYSPHGVPGPGWHDITIKIKKPGEFKILARKGYDGGPGGK